MTIAKEVNWKRRGALYVHERIHTNHGKLTNSVEGRNAFFNGGIMSPVVGSLKGWGCLEGPNILIMN